MLQHFFEGVEARVAQGVREEEVSYQLAFNKQELRKVIKEYPGKEVKKGLDNLYKKVDKHLCEEESLLQVRHSKLDGGAVWSHSSPLLSELIHSFFRPTRWCGTPCKTSSSVSTSTLKIWLADATQDLESPWSLPSKTCWSISPVLPNPTSLTAVHFIPVVIYHCLTMTDETWATLKASFLLYGQWPFLLCVLMRENCTLESGADMSALCVCLLLWDKQLYAIYFIVFVIFCYVCMPYVYNKFAVACLIQHWSVIDYLSHTKLDISLCACVSSPPTAFCTDNAGSQNTPPLMLPDV